MRHKRPSRIRGLLYAGDSIDIGPKNYEVSSGKILLGGSHYWVFSGDAVEGKRITEEHFKTLNEGLPHPTNNILLYKCGSVGAIECPGDLFSVGPLTAKSLFVADDVSSAYGGIRASALYSHTGSISCMGPLEVDEVWAYGNILAGGIKASKVTSQNGSIVSYMRDLCADNVRAWGGNWSPDDKWGLDPSVIAHLKHDLDWDLIANLGGKPVKVEGEEVGGIVAIAADIHSLSDPNKPTDFLWTPKGTVSASNARLRCFLAKQLNISNDLEVCGRSYAPNGGRIGGQLRLLEHGSLTHCEQLDMQKPTFIDDEAGPIEDVEELPEDPKFLLKNWGDRGDLRFGGRRQGSRKPR